MLEIKTYADHRVAGWFWRPEVPDARVPGILTWSQAEGATLELIGGLSFAGDLSESLTEDDRPDIGLLTILGMSQGGKKLTLWQAQAVNEKIGISGTWIVQKWVANWFVVGLHADSQEGVQFGALTAEIDDLYYLTHDARLCTPQWTRIRGVENPGERQANGTHLMPWSMGVVGGRRAEVETGVLGGLKYSVETFATYPWVSDATERYPDLKLGLMTRNVKRGLVFEVEVSARARVVPVDDAVVTGNNILDALSPILHT